MRLQREKLARFKKHWLTFAFFAGFVVDNITLNRVDQVFDNLVLLGYVLLASGSLLFLYASLAEKVPERFRPFLLKWTPMAVQFSFGGLLSGILVFYSRSGSWFLSWPFLLLILCVIVGNEFITKRAQRLVFNLVVLFVGIFSYAVLVVPVLLGSMGALVFLLSGVVTVLVFAVFVRLLYRIVPNFLTANLKPVIFSLGMTFAMLNFLYFANIIPPIPLSLKHIGVYHNVERTNESTYLLTYEEGRWFEPFKDSDTTFHARQGDAVFCYASVFAPTRLATTIFHKWEYKDENGDWVMRSRLSYPIEGGRGDGFRGYTLQREYTEGTWRCTVETERGQVLGRESFTITRDGEPGTFTVREDG